MTSRIVVATHPLLEVGAFVARIAAPVEAPASIVALIVQDATEFRVDENVRTAVRDLLRAGGFKPAGRSKPASEYLVTALAEGRFPRINALVDACNVASLHTGLPISLVDADRLTPGDLRIACCPTPTSYVFNPSGQTIDASGLLALFDPDGPTGTPVKDAQRTKTSDATRTALAIVWGTKALPGLTARATAFYRGLVDSIPGAITEDVEVI